MKNLHGLLSFVEIASVGSLAAAADLLNITPAAVSKGLTSLERQLGVRLIHRSTRRLSLTAEGVVFLDKAKTALRLLDEAVAEVSQSVEVPVGLVRISVGSGFGRRWVLPALPPLLAKYPQLTIEIDLENRPVDLIATGFDIGIRGGFIEDSSLVARRICALPVALFASPAYLREAGVPAHPNDFAEHRCISLRSATGTEPEWVFWNGRRSPVKFKPRRRLTTSDPETLLDLALSGAGIVQAGLYNAVPYLRTGRLKLLMPDIHDSGKREFVVHYPHRRYLAPRVRVVVDALLAHFAKLRELHWSVAQVFAEIPNAVAKPAPKNQVKR